MSSLHNSRFQNPYIRLLTMIFALGVALGSGLGYGFGQAISNSEQEKILAQTKVGNVNCVKYERLRLGMSLTDVLAILGGNGTEVDRTSTTATFFWDNLGCSKIVVTFEDGKLKSKKQFLLK